MSQLNMQRRRHGKVTRKYLKRCYPDEVIDFALESFKEGYTIAQTTRRVNEKYGCNISKLGVRGWYHSYYDPQKLKTAVQTPPQVLKFALAEMDKGIHDAEIQRRIEAQLGYPVGNGAVAYWRRKYRPETITSLTSRHYHWTKEALAMAIDLATNSDILTCDLIAKEINKHYPALQMRGSNVRQAIPRFIKGFSWKERRHRLIWKGRKCNGCNSTDSYMMITPRDKPYPVWRRYKGQWYCFRCFARIETALNRYGNLSDSDVTRICKEAHYMQKNKK